MPHSHGLTDAEEEQLHVAKVIQTFKSYAKSSLSANNRRRKDIYTLPLADQEMLKGLGYLQKLDAVDDAIVANAEFLNQIVANPEIFGHNIDSLDIDDVIPETPAEETPEILAVPHSHSDLSHSHGHSHDHSHELGHANPPAFSGKPKRYKPTEFDMDKLRSTIKQFVRDWSGEGKVERDACYGPIKDALLEHYSDIPLEERGNFRVLVPGVGLGRLAFDVASLGFTCQGNEFSHYMLLSSYMMLNKTDEINKYTIYPYIHSFSNAASRNAMLRSVSIPDVLPSALPEGSDFSLVAGDFEEIYGAEGDADTSEPQAGQWDAVLTCFFIDTATYQQAKNIVNYLRIIHRILAPGGVWINLGPLLWHFENNQSNDPSIELDLDEVKALARQIGFELSKEKTIDTSYTSNAQSMLGYMYHAEFWVATKTV
ncbi:N2227-domain-containing protein [Athelia psychrophila]|uniref:carnosine N-methyltransferase n=1 Tax=Athelia psychrophila TaxID=1759441 RepID=A0A166J0D2_9AGAM|nr:N2227-domain-containing protein [Fibularhizoctonia sp. CBS 109695]